MLIDVLREGLGAEILKDVDVVIQRTGKMETENVTKLALDVLGLDEELKAMAFNISVEGFINIKERVAKAGELLLRHGEPFTLDEEWIEERE